MLALANVSMRRAVFWMAFGLLGTLWISPARADVATRTADITEERYGAKPDDGKDDTTAIQKAIDDLNESGALIIPPGAFAVSMGRGLTISKNHIHVIVKGTIEATTGGLEAAACKSLFYVTGRGCQFIGQGGMLTGDGSTFHGPWSKEDRLYDVFYPPLIYFRGAHEGSVSGLRLRNPPGLHIVVFGSGDCRITNCIMEGGTERASDGDKILDGNRRHPCSRYFGIFMRGGSSLLIQGNHFKPVKGRSQYQWICSSSTNTNWHVSILGNVFEGAFDHCIYCSGLRRSVVSNNITRDSVSSPIKLIGTDIVVTGNNIYNAPYGGIECRNGSRCVVADNVIDQFGHEGICITRYGQGPGAHTDNIVTGNILIGHTGKGKSPVMWGIHISARDSVSRCKVEGNIIHNTGTGNPELRPTLPGSPAIEIGSGKPSHAVTIRGNTIHNAGANGIEVTNLHAGLITHNMIHCDGKPVLDRNGHGNVIEKNIVRGEQIESAK